MPDFKVFVCHKLKLFLFWCSHKHVWQKCISIDLHFFHINCMSSCSIFLFNDSVLEKLSMSTNISYFDHCNSTENFVTNSSLLEKLGLFFADLCWPLYFSIFLIYLLIRYKEDLDPAHLFALNPLMDSICIGTVFTINEQLNIWTDFHEELQ